MKIVKRSGRQFREVMARLDGRMESGPSNVEGAVSKIIRDVRKNGDKALLAYTKKFDKASFTTRTMKVSRREFDNAEKIADATVVRALEKSAVRITRFHRKQKEASWSAPEKDATLGQLIRPLESAGIYIPGGGASYPSSVLMNALPARIAGVKRIVMVTPAPGGALNPHTLVAAKIAGVTDIYKVGGAQAVAALAYGTKTIKPVDKITGPGNVYVAEAKRQVFGKVDIDMVAGPSEILVIADGSANPKFIAADLLSQAEHDENAYPLLVTTSSAIAAKVEKELETQTRALKRSALIRKCLRRNCFAIVVKSLNEAFEISNRIAPEHLELQVENADKYVSCVINAGAVFVGPWTPEALGDYSAGPNHTLPTGGSARFFSPLGVYDFVKRTSLLSFSEKGMRRLAKSVIAIAKEEGLSAHAHAVEIRIKK